MTKAADIIAALVADKSAPVLERQTRMPYGWALWLRALKSKSGAPNREGADAVIRIFAQRPVPATPPRPAALSRWQALRSLFYQDWGPPLREERGLRWFSGGASVLMHVLFAVLLLMLALVRVPPLQPASDSSRVQVEFIGDGTPQDMPEPGTSAAPLVQEESQPAAAPAQTAAAEPASASPTAAEALQPDAAPAPPVAQQTLQVTETETPTIDFVLPQATVRTPQIAPPQIAPREIAVPTREITVVQAPSALRPLPQRDIPVPQIAPPAQEIRQREIPTPLPQIRTVQAPARPLAAPQVRATVPSVRQAEIPSPNPVASSADSSANPVAENTASAAVNPQATAADTAKGPATASRPGGATTPKRGDDWGDSARDRPGASTGARAGDGTGLFNPDGSVRVPGDSTGDSTQPGPPGSRQQQLADADRASKWLERPDYPYEPTMFDKYWRPTDESLLGEWVRRAISEVEIPIPGTSKKVKCIVSVLQAGGACSLLDPNLNEQPANARPPPDIPVKRNPIPTDS